MTMTYEIHGKGNRRTPLADQVIVFELFDEVALQTARLMANYRHYLIGQNITDAKTQRVLMAEFARLMTDHLLTPDNLSTGIDK